MVRIGWVGSVVGVDGNSLDPVFVRGQLDLVGDILGGLLGEFCLVEGLLGEEVVCLGFVEALGASYDWLREASVAYGGCFGGG